MNPWHFVTPILCALVGWLVYPVLFPKTREEQIHDEQQKALERHRKSREADRKTAEAYWKGRGQVIKPMDRDRYCSHLDEREPLT